MKLTIITSCGAWGGAEVQTAGLANRLAERGHRVTLVTYGTDQYARHDWDRRPEVELIHHDAPAPKADFGWAAAWALVRPLDGDVCVVSKPSYDHGNWRLELAPRLRFRRFFTIEQCTGDAPLPKTSRRYLFGLLPGPGLWWYRYRLRLRLRAMGPRRVVCVSDGVKARLVNDYSYPHKKLLTVHNGIDSARYRPDPAQRLKTRQAWGVPDDALVFGAVGRLAHMKGYDMAIDAFAKLRAGRPNLDPWLVLTGEGQEEGRLRAQAKAAGCGERVVFAGFNARPWEAHVGLDVFVMPSRTEGLPLSLLEAMASGCRPVAMGVGGIPEVITSPSLGWLVAPEDRAGFLAGLAAAADASPEECARMSECVVDHARTHFDARTQFDRVVEVIESL